MTLYSLTHLGRERPFELTAEDRARRRSWLKTIGAVVAIGAGLTTIIVGMVRLPAEVSVAVAKSVQTKLDDRYVQIKDNDHAAIMRYADEKAAESAGYVDVVKRSVIEELRISEAKAIERDNHTNERLDKILFHAASMHGLLDNAAMAPPAYRPLPARKP